MEAINRLSRAQETLGNEMNKILVNMKKDSSSRKTPQYLEERTNTVQKIWSEIKSNDSEITRLKKEETETASYFTTKYFEQIHQIYEETVQHITEQQKKIAESERRRKSSRSSDSEGELRQLALIREQEIRLEDIKESLELAKLEAGEDKSRNKYQWVLQQLEKEWETISQLNVTIKINESKFSHPYFIENKFQKTKFRYSEIVELLHKKVHEQSATNVKLPEIKIPVFDGKYEEWTTFQDIFTKVIDKNNNISNTEKMQYLKTYVKGEASKSIKHFQINETNYVCAWKELRDMYDNERLTVSKLVGKIMELPSISYESAEKLKQIYTTTRECLESIKMMGIDTGSWGPIIGYVIATKWDAGTNNLYEASLKNPMKVQNIEEMLSFLRSRFQAIESTTEKKKPWFQAIESTTEKKKSWFHPTSTVGQQVKCSYCKAAGHMVYTCMKFKSAQTDERIKFAKENKLCFNCLTHEFTIKCRSKRNCHICNRNHHTLLHQDGHKNKTAGRNKPGESQQQQRNIATHLVENKNENTILLATAVIKIQTSSNGYEYFRALIDSGSQSSFITEEAATLINLPREKIRAEISGIGSENVMRCNTKIQVRCKPRHSSNFILNTEMLILPKLTTALPEKTLNTDLDQWRNCILADPSFHKTGPIDVIIGAPDYREIILEGVRKTSDNLLGQNTEFGWIICGSNVSIPTKQMQVISMITCVEENNKLARFWEMEEIREERKLTSDEQTCEENYNNTVQRNDDGSYTVQIPFKDDTTLGESRSRAIARLLQLEKRLHKNNVLGQAYKQFMMEYLNLGHMIPVPQKEYNKGRYYIPHQAVTREESTTTKLRVVFDASCRTDNGKCLNDIMHVGPCLQQELPDVLIRWRTHKIVLKADIEKMYRQIKINTGDQEYHRILWRFKPNQPIQEFKLTTVTYGTASAPYLAIKTIQQLAKDEETRYPQAAKIATKDFYVDDLLTGTGSEEEAIIIQQQLINMFRSGGCTLRKWTSNNWNVQQDIPEELRDGNLTELGENDLKKTLGINWAPQDDTIRFKVQLLGQPPSTKRTILSEVAKLFDPLGWLAPVVVKAKLIIQALWQEDVGWDDRVPGDVQERWNKFYTQLSDMEKIILPRWTNQYRESKIELHGFCDASEKAFGAVVYIKVTNCSQETTITLVTAKSKVAPIKTRTTLPRLELCAATLLAKLLNRVQYTLQVEHDHIYAWSDSTITLSWIKGDAQRWKTFVANRVSTICQNVNPCNWYHVRSEENPAGCISRGVDPSKLKDYQQWWQGPAWLKKSHYPTKQMQTEHVTEEIKSLHTHIQTEVGTNDIISKFSSRTRLIRVVAYCHRFKFNCKNPTKKQIGYMTTTALQTAEEKIISQQQQNSFGQEIRMLSKNETLRKNHKISSLNPFLDGNGIMRVGGRLQESLLTYNEKHPIILSSEDHLAYLIIREAHMTTIHGGNQQTLAYVRRKYWILNGKKAVKNVINKCSICVRHKARTAQQLMGQLPAPRVRPSAPFSSTGIDYAGPIQIRVSKGRGNKSYKGYIAIFVCLATKAIHLEVVSDMTAEAFVAALKRFVSRRGNCTNIYSDNGTNFVGASKTIENETYDMLKNSTIPDELTTKGIQWHFIPPSSPHFGGLWEAGVKSTKFHLKRVIGQATLTFEELTTLTHQIEASLNSRPLCPLTEDIHDTSILTPGHFLIGRALLTPSDEVDEGVNGNLTGRWKMIQKMNKQFWNAWSTEYIHNLQQRSKWKTPQENLKIGDLVLIKEQDFNANKWPLARIIDTHPDKEGIVRVVTLQKSRNQTMKRPIHKLILLPTGANEPKSKQEDDTSNEEIVKTSCNIANTSRQQSRRSYSWSAIMTILCYLLQICKAAKMYHIENPNAGIYIEKIGLAKIDRGSFRIELQFEKSRILEDLASVNQTVSQINKMCEKVQEVSPITECKSLVRSLKEKERQLHWLKKGLEKLIVNRQKRGVLGQVLTSLFVTQHLCYKH